MRLEPVESPSKLPDWIDPTGDLRVYHPVPRQAAQAIAPRTSRAESALRLITKREAGVNEEFEGSRQLPHEGVSLVSKAWLRHGPKGMFGGADPGLLTARGGRVSFATGPKTVFEAARHEIRVNWPWWEFGAGVHMSVSGKIYRLSFARPPGDLDEDDTGITSIPGARAAGKAWKNYLGG
jgi:hypothetical protein